MAKTAQHKGSSQKFTEIQDIGQDIVTFTNGQAVVVIEVQATNFSLLSNQEQDARIFAYASLLNSLSFPIQILIRNKRIDVSSYVSLLEEEAKKTQNEQLSSYIGAYKDFVQELVKVNTVLDKKFYVIIPYSYLEKGVSGATSQMKKDSKQKTTFLKDAQASLRTKADSLHAQLARLNLRAKTLDKEELIKLFYDVYNPEVATPHMTPDTKNFIVKGGTV